jgi:hypothetical protein
MRFARRHLILPLGLLLALVPAAARADWGSRCIASHGTCYGCCALALVEMAFNSIGGWN